MIDKALEKLGVSNYILEGNPSNEQEFNSMFKKVVGEDDQGSAIMSQDPKDFGVTWSEIELEVEKVKNAWNNTEYQRQRAPEYPPIGDQLDDLFRAGAFSPEMAAKIQAIKDKYPKGS